ncbi:MAG: WecB/TagA/CpsF family glycosyltransferase [Gomphosphaeria aponina SAG 52.96 = DSM 107014]|uniref:WecB/TagA/CpsF family glycosyltransferase n=1 Tax=Gomphosphaeria aponina SAG 52.96 = DSM 107014 TaxID=1521640 RepID=A0A941JLI1_9CHRO|nr:WecB/TagA/CpsF family glycosyltransferase [Gomphosphaeria aponina SAG 52.96 = DSM 107014]
MSLPNLEKRLILKTSIYATSYEDACDRIFFWATNSTSCYIVAANVHVIMTAYWQREYQEIIEGAALVTPDGMPLVLGMGLLGIKKQSRVYGPDLMLAWCDRAAQVAMPIYLYGGTESALSQLQYNLKKQFPGIIITGSYSPPFRQLTPAEVTADRDRIHASGAKVVFVGLGCPKQEEWMAQQVGKLQAVMIGVGAAFSFHSGEVSQAPRWMMSWGLEWLYRLITEPQRLWKRYLINNPAFVFLFGLQLVKHWLGILRKSQ